MGIGRIILGCVLTVLTGCGTYVPYLQDIGGSSAQLLVQAIVESVHCELRRSLVDVIDQDKKLAKYNGVRSAPWLDTWGVQIGLTLQIDEKSTVSPSALWMPASTGSSMFTLGGGASVAASATRIDKLNYYYAVRDLYDLGKCHGTDTKASRGSFLIENDLKIGEWLSSQILASSTGAISVPVTPSTPLKQNALSHQVKFELLTSGNVTPAWRLAEATFNQSGSLFSTSRNRVHDLVLTFGPMDGDTKGLVGAAASIFLASQINSAIGLANRQ